MHWTYWTIPTTLESLASNNQLSTAPLGATQRSQLFSSCPLWHPTSIEVQCSSPFFFFFPYMKMHICVHTEKRTQILASDSCLKKFSPMVPGYASSVTWLPALVSQTSSWHRAEQSSVPSFYTSACHWHQLRSFKHLIEAYVQTCQIIFSCSLVWLLNCPLYFSFQRN